MTFNVQENAVFIHQFSKHIPTVGEGNPPPLLHLPSHGRFAPSLCLPSLTNPGCTTVTGIAIKVTQVPTPPR